MTKPYSVRSRPSGDGSGSGVGVGVGMSVVVAGDAAAMQTQVIWLVQSLLPSVCMYSPEDPKLGQYTQPNGLPEA